MLSSNLILGVKRVEHDDGADIVFEDHPPEVDDGVRERHLRQDVRVAALVTLNNNNKQ